MRSLYIILLCGLLFNIKADAAQCEDGWSIYKDLLCIKAFPTLLTYDEAKDFCAEQGSEQVNSSLVMVKNPDLQAHLVSITTDIFDNLWLGSKYDEESGDFKWLDGEPLNYSNWDEGYPRNITDPKTCIELRPQTSKISVNPEGKWIHSTCQKRSLVMCQRTLVWSLQDAVDEIVRLRTRFAEELQAVSSRVVPVGSIYIEYYDQSSPPTLWPDLEWEDITSTYAGLFFRAEGGGAAGWGSVQSECAPRISQMEGSFSSSGYSNPLSIPSSGWSNWGHAGLAENGWIDVIRFYTSGCEVRPRNQAIRVWKRTA